MHNIKILKTNIDVSAIAAQLEQYADDWGHQKKLQGVDLQDPERYHTDSNVLQLVMGGLEHEGQYVGNSEICLGLPTLERHSEIVDFVRRHFGTMRRAAFLGLPVGASVGQHRDYGSYYLGKHRYHLSIQGRYWYRVGNEEITVEPGTLFWFNNKLVHEAKDIGDVERISFVFDVPEDYKYQDI